jgi:hypothetical protein
LYTVAKAQRKVGRNAILPLLEATKPSREAGFVFLTHGDSENGRRAKDKRAEYNAKGCAIAKPGDWSHSLRESGAQARNLGIAMKRLKGMAATTASFLSSTAPWSESKSLPNDWQHPTPW